VFFKKYFCSSKGNYWLLLLLIVHNYLSAQNFSGEIKTQKTNEHVNVNGTRLFMVIPDGFSEIKYSSGFSGLNFTTIYVSDYPGESFYVKAKSVSKSDYEARFDQVTDFSEFSINNYPAKFVALNFKKESDYKKMMRFIFGDSTFCVSINVYISDENIDTENIKKSLLSVWYDKTMVLNHVGSAPASLPFTLDDRNTKLKFAGGNTFVCRYMHFKKVQPLIIDSTGPALTVSIPYFPEPNKSVEDLSEQQLTELGKRRTKNITTEKTQRFQRDGYDFLETINYGTVAGQKMLVYQLVVKKNNQIVIINGMATDNFKQNIEEFKELAYTIRIK
jgi:hypothetical protein